jgi:hypothetical protein
MVFAKKPLGKLQKEKFAAPFANGSWLKTISKYPSSALFFIMIAYTFPNPPLITNGCKTIRKLL